MTCMYLAIKLEWQIAGDGWGRWGEAGEERENALAGKSVILNSPFGSCEPE